VKLAYVALFPAVASPVSSLAHAIAFWRAARPPGHTGAIAIDLLGPRNDARDQRRSRNAIGESLLERHLLEDSSQVDLLVWKSCLAKTFSKPFIVSYPIWTVSHG